MTIPKTLRLLILALAVAGLVVPAPVFASNPYAVSHGNFYAKQKIVASNAVAAPLVVTVPVTSYAVHVEQFDVPHYYSVNEYGLVKAAIRDAFQELAEQGLVLVPVTEDGVVRVPIENLPKSGKEYSQWEPAEIAKAGEQDVLSAALSIFKARCANCHTEGSASAGFSLVREDGTPVSLTRLEASAIYGQVASGLMPQGADKDPSKRLSENELAWLHRLIQIK